MTKQLFNINRNFSKINFIRNYLIYVQRNIRFFFSKTKNNLQLKNTYIKEIYVNCFI